MAARRRARRSLRRRLRGDDELHVAVRTERRAVAAADAHPPWTRHQRRTRRLRKGALRRRRRTRLLRRDPRRVQAGERLQRARSGTKAHRARTGADSRSHRRSRRAIRDGRVRARARVVSLSQLGVVRGDAVTPNVLAAAWDRAFVTLPQWRAVRPRLERNVMAHGDASAWLTAI